MMGTKARFTRRQATLYFALITSDCLLVVIVANGHLVDEERLLLELRQPLVRAPLLDRHAHVGRLQRVGVLKLIIS